jgi:hypothetical protein
MRRTLRLVPGVLLALTASACDESLMVENLSSPDVDRVFATPASIEQTIASGYQACHNAHVVNADLNAQMLVMSLESYSQLNNFFMGPRGGIPRSPVVNIRGTDGNHFGPFSRFSRAGRLSANAINALDKLTAPPTNGTLGTPGQNARARAFAFFALACNQGFLALTFDSAGVVVNGMPSDEVPELSGYADVMAAAIRMLDSAEAIANSAVATTTGGFPLPATWMSAAANVSRDDFVRVVRSYRARFRANVARTPAERAAVDWNAVIADANAGITTDHMVSAGGSTGWNIGFIGSQMHVEPGWSQMSMMYYGMADVSGGYDAWLAVTPNDRSPFLVITPDQRWPAGATRAAQRTASVQPSGPTSRPYVSNRTVEDAPGDGWGWSFYDFYRYKYIRNASNQGLWPSLMKAEVDLLAAEGYIRTNQIALAAAKIDISRVGRGGLPALTGVVTTATQPVPGGASCVPRVPQGALGPTACGNIMEAMKWEKRMETAYSGFGQWFFDGRGWGDLVENTPLQYPVPFQELDARSKPYYGLGGGGASSAAKGTYGF